MAFWEPLIVCSGVANDTTKGPNGEIIKLPVCDFGSLITLLNVLIHDLVVISTLLAGCVFAYAGFILLTSGGNQSALEDAKKIFIKVLKGYLWILAAWVIVYTITNTLLGPGYTLLTK